MATDLTAAALNGLAGALGAGLRVPAIEPRPTGATDGGERGSRLWGAQLDVLCITARDPGTESRRGHQWARGTP